MLSKCLQFSPFLVVLCYALKGDEQSLHNDLMQNYSKHVRPVKNASHQLVVTVDLAVIKIVDVDLKNEVMTTNVQLLQQWRDEFLTWDPDKYSGVKRIELSPDIVWLPDINLANDVADQKSQKTLPKAVILHTGHVLWNPKMQLKSLCEMDATFFPFDVQQCFLVFFSWTYSEDKLKVTSGQLFSEPKIFFAQDNTATAFRVTRVSLQALVSPEYWPTAELNLTSNYTELAYGIELKRKVLYHSYTILGPSFIISILTVLIFRLSPASGEKIELGVTILLVFHVMLWTIGEKLPENSTTIPLLAIYLSTVMTLTSVSVIMAIIIINVYNKGTTTELPGWLRVVALGHLAPLFRLPVPPRSAKFPRRKRALSSLMLNSTMTLSWLNLQAINGERTAEERPVLLDILKTVDAIHSKLESDTLDASVALEWRCVAKVLDRSLFWIYFFVTTSLTLFILVVVPYLQGSKPLDYSR